MFQVVVVVGPVQIVRGYPILAAEVFARAVAPAPFVLAAKSSAWRVNTVTRGHNVALDRCVRQVRATGRTCRPSLHCTRR
jgi:hypothetical protein